MLLELLIFVLFDPVLVILNVRNEHIHGVRPLFVFLALLSCFFLELKGLVKSFKGVQKYFIEVVWEFNFHVVQIVEVQHE
jgi:hypothetical protein